MNSTLVKPRCAYAHNLLDNSDFRAPVNQRGRTGYVGHVCTIDRWVLWSDKFTASLAVEDGGIALNPESSTVYSLAQRFEKGTLKDTDYTLAYCDYTGNVYIAPSPIIRQDAFDFVQIAGSAWNKIVWAALYEGAYTADTLPPYVPKEYAAELAACQRYYYRVFNPLATYQVAGIATAISATQAIAAVPLQAPMRMEVPSLVAPDATSLSLQGGTMIKLTGLTMSNVSSGTAKLVCTVSGGLTVGQSYVLTNANNASNLAFSSDL